MNWEAIGAIGEIVGAIAVVVTIGYLAVQIRQNTRAVRASTHHGITHEWNALNVAFASDPAVSSLVLRGAEDYSQLDRDERFRYTLLMRAAIGTYNDAFLQFREHLISEEVWATYRPVLAAILGSAGAREWWERNRQLYPEEFQQEISRFLAA